MPVELSIKSYFQFLSCLPCVKFHSTDLKVIFVTRNEARCGVGFYGVVKSLIFFVTMKFAFSSSENYACEGSGCLCL